MKSLTEFIKGILHLSNNEINSKSEPIKKTVTALAKTIVSSDPAVISLINGNINAPGEPAMKYSVPAINEFIDDCTKYLYKKYKKYITDENELNYRNSCCQGTEWTFKGISDQAAGIIFCDIVSYAFNNPAEKLFKNEYTKFSGGYYKLVNTDFSWHYQNDTKHYRYFFDFELELVDADKEFITYINPSFELNTVKQVNLPDDIEYYNNSRKDLGYDDLVDYLEDK